MKYLYVILAIVLLICLCPMPYGYYTLIRFVSMCAFVYMAYEHFSKKQETLGFIFVALTLLFQPFFKLALGRVMWNVVDVVVAIGLIVLFFKTTTNNED